MARPIKKGLDYFPVDTNILSDLKVRRIKRKYGAESFLLYMTLLCDIYANSFYIYADDNYLFDLSEKMQMSESQTLEMVLAMVKIGLFDSQLFQKKRILTSASIQKRFFPAKRSRMDLFDNDEIELVLVKIDSAKTPVITAETSQNEGLSTQSKEEKSKGNTSSSSSCVRETTTNCGKIFAGFQAELLDNEDWRASVVRMSGKGIATLQVVPEVMDMFDMHVISIGKSGEIRNSNQYAEHFINWWRCMRFRSAAEIEAYHQQRIQEAKRSAQPEKKSKVRQAVELGDVVSANVKKIMLG